ncbi:MAG: hypothetical protein ABJH07_07835 [Sedimentitalea sp.]|uniref:hypothetical protein n=1 Tax=Sedimentitalea sp. TaxID=2048915 RepID=UPI00326607BE
MADEDASTKTELIHPDKLEVLRRLARLSVFALAVPFVAIMIPSLSIAFLDADSNILITLINLSWVLVIFGGFAFLVVSLFSAAVLFRVFNMHDKAHSLGLPRNSIRSLLTFLIFLILMAFIFYSTQVVSTQHSTGLALIPYSELDATIASLGLSDTVTGYEIVEREGGEAVAHVTFLVEQESAAMEYFDRILVALLGISSTIIGFYFGSRSQEALDNPSGGGAESEEQVNTEVSPLAPGAADEVDSLEWSVNSSVLTLSKGDDGRLTGVVIINPSDPEGDREFGARFVPTETHDTAIDAANIAVVRVADRLTLHVTGVDADALMDKELEISVYYRDEEEQAKTVPVELLAPEI